MRSFGKYRVNPMKQSILGIAPGFASVPKVKDFEEAGLTISTDRHEDLKTSLDNFNAVMPIPIAA